jgi:hypothetical protein
MLRERLGREWQARWQARKSAVPIEAAMRFTPDGLVLGAGTVLAAAEGSPGGKTIRLEGCEARLATLLSAAHLEPIAPGALNHIRKAAMHWSVGETDRAEVHLALSRLARPEHPGRAAQRLFLADGLLEAGVEPDAILKALNLDPSPMEALTKDYRTQPRVPEGSGRTSGEWTSGAGPGGSNGGRSHGRPVSAGSASRGTPQTARPGVRDARGVGRTPAAPAQGLLQTTPKIAAPVARRPWFLNLTATQVGELALLVARFAGPTVALGTIFIPFNKSLRQEGTIAGWPPIHFQRRADQRAIVFSYLGPNLRTVLKTAELDRDGLFRDADKNVIGRALPDGGVVIDRSAILPKEARDENEPTLCPKPVPDKGHGNLNGLRYENFMKALINPGNPTPSKFAIGMRNPETGKDVMLDDCQRRSGILFEYKGPTYKWLLSTGFRYSVLGGLAYQAERQLKASQGRPVVWIFEEKSAKEFVENAFDSVPELSGRIQFDYEPMPGFSK